MDTMNTVVIYMRSKKRTLEIRSNFKEKKIQIKQGNMTFLFVFIKDEIPKKCI